ncbi:MAG: class II fructose-bisphosphate aldolase [Candidatus Omnitrophica bacterium]|nr:class II fructose-bisphosphate aldolase [Candidatus Omnitrophota bacterium]
MQSKVAKKILSIVVTVAFLSTNTVYAAPSTRSLFKDKQVDYKKLSTQREESLNQKKAVLRGDEQASSQEQKKEAKRILQSHLEDLSQIHIPSETGRVIEVYQNPDNTSHRLIVHIQDLHTNPEAELNLANILEMLKKDYNLDLVCSEGADGIVDTSSVSSFPDYEVREKTARLFINSGELTGEEYLSITKYPELPIWGIENRDIYFQNIIEFNKIMKFNPDSRVFINQAKEALEQLKPKAYSKEILSIDQKEADYENKKIETDEYLKYLTSYLQKFNISVTDYQNIFLLMEATNQEKNIDQAKIIQESQNLLLNLQAEIAKKDTKSDLDSLMVKAQLFKDKKISPFSFYSYLKDIALRHLSGGMSKYPALNEFVDYLTKVNSLDATKLFVEMEALSYDVKQRLAKTDEEKTLTQALRNIKFLEGFFNLKVSNEELDYYIENKDSHKVAFFEAFLKPALKKYNISTYIDFNSGLIDSHLDELESFYKIVKARDIAMVSNSISEIDKRDAKVVALIAGGFHTKGITKLLKDKGYSYIVVSPYSSTDIDEENYHFLLSGRRKPITELIEEINSLLRVPLSFSSDRFIAWLAKAHAQAVGDREIDALFTDSGAIIEQQYVLAAIRMLRKKRRTTEQIIQALREYFPKLGLDELVGISKRGTIYVRLGDRFITVTAREGIVALADINEEGFEELEKIGKSATTKVAIARQQDYLVEIEGNRDFFRPEWDFFLQKLVDVRIVKVLVTPSGEVNDVTLQAASLLPHVAIGAVFRARQFMATNGHKHAGEIGDETALGAAVPIINDIHRAMGLSGEMRAIEGKKDNVWVLEIGVIFGDEDAPRKFTLIGDPVEITAGLRSLTQHGTVSFWALAKADPEDLENTGFLSLPDKGAYLVEVLSSKPAAIDVRKSEKENLLAIAEAHGKDIKDLRGSMLFRDRHYKMLMNMILAGVNVDDAELMELAQEGLSDSFETKYQEFWEELNARVNLEGMVEIGNMVFIKDGTVEESLGIAREHVDFVIDTTATTEGIASAAILQAAGKGDVIDGKTRVSMRLISQKAPVHSPGTKDYALTSLQGLQERAFLDWEKRALGNVDLNTAENRTQIFVGTKGLTRSDEVVYTQAHFKPSRKPVSGLEIPGVQVDNSGIGEIHFITAATGLGITHLSAKYETRIAQLLNAGSDEDDLVAQGDLALAWVRAGDFDRAIAIVEKALERNNTDTRLNAINNFIMGMRALTQDNKDVANENAFGYFGNVMQIELPTEPFVEQARMLLTWLGDRGKVVSILAEREPGSLEAITADIVYEMARRGGTGEEIASRITQLVTTFGTLEREALERGLDPDRVIAAYGKIMREVAGATIAGIIPEEIGRAMSLNQQALLQATSNGAETIAQFAAIEDLVAVHHPALLGRDGREGEVGHVDALVFNPWTEEWEAKLTHPAAIRVMDAAVVEALERGLDLDAYNNGSGHGTKFNAKDLEPDSQVGKISPWLTGEHVKAAGEFRAAPAQHGTSGSDMDELAVLAEMGVIKFNVATHFQQKVLDVLSLLDDGFKGDELMQGVLDDEDAYVVVGLHRDTREKIKRVARAFEEGTLTAEVEATDSLFMKFMKLTYAWGISKGKIKQGASAQDIAVVFAKEFKRGFKQMDKDLYALAQDSPESQKVITFVTRACTAQYLQAVGAANTADLVSFPDFEFAPGRDVYKALMKAGQATIAANLVCYNQLEGLILAAMDLNAILIIEVARSQLDYALDEVTVMKYIREIVKKTGCTIPIVVHGDHIQYTAKLFAQRAILEQKYDEVNGKGAFKATFGDRELIEIADEIPMEILTAVQAALQKNAEEEREVITRINERLIRAGFTSIAIDASTIFDAIGGQAVLRHYLEEGTPEEQVVANLERDYRLPLDFGTNALKARLLDLIKPAITSRKQQVDSNDQIIAIPASKVIVDKDGFETWIAQQAGNTAVVIIAMPDEYDSVKGYEDIAYIKVIGKDIGEEYRLNLIELFGSYGNDALFGGFKLGTPYSLDKYRSVIDKIASGV